MAMRARGGGAATPSRGRIGGGGVRPVFEEFRPVSEWQLDDESHTLVIYLPGFMKEQIKVSTEGQNTIRVRGERLVAGNKWNRFLEDFQVPENCEMNSIRAKFQGGILNITVPKRILNKPQYDDPLLPKTSSSSAAISPKKQTTPLKGQEKVLPPIASQPKDEKDSEPQKMLRNSGTEIRQAPDKLKEKHLASGRADDAMKPMVQKESHDSERKLPEHVESAKKIKPEKEALTALITNEEKIKQQKELKGKETSESSRPADYRASAFATGKKYAKGLGELNEERQLLVNMGVAVLVIVALSAYVTYNFVSAKDKN